MSSDYLSGYAGIQKNAAKLYTNGKRDPEKIKKALGLSFVPKKDLFQLERIHRLNCMIKSPSFKKWLKQPLPCLDGISPMECITSGRAKIIAEMVEDILTGQPG